MNNSTYFAKVPERNLKWTKGRKTRIKMRNIAENTRIAECSQTRLWDENW